MENKAKLSVVVPCYNEEQNISHFYNELDNALSGYMPEYEVIFVNDGSRDNTWREIKKIYKEHKGIKAINLSRNFGKESAMYAGLSKAEGEFITIIDADLQQKPELIIDMVEFLKENEDYDSVAMYQKNRNEGWLLNLYKKTFYRIINSICDIDFHQGASDFRTFRRNVLEAVLEMKEFFRFSKGIFSWVGFETYYMPYTAEKRKRGNSSWSFSKLFKYAVNGIVAFTTFPLKISTGLGIASSIAAFVYMVFVIIQKLCFGIAVPGYATTTVLILFIGGIQLVSLGILGQYISKIYLEGKKRPIYITKNYLSDDCEK